MKKAICMVILLLALAGYASHKRYQATTPKDSPEQSGASVSSNEAKTLDNAPERQEEVDWLNRLLKWPDGVGALAVILTLGAIVWQSDETRRAANASIQAERAWVFAELSSFDAITPPSIGNHANRIKNEEQTFWTSTQLKLSHKNEGSSPAWIDNVRARMEITKNGEKVRSDTKDFEDFNTPPPIGVGKTSSSNLNIKCSGRVEDGDFVFIWVVIDYHDAFGTKGKTSLFYLLMPGAGLFRNDRMPERNWNK